MVSVSCFGVRVSVIFHFMFVHYTFSSVWVPVPVHCFSITFLKHCFFLQIRVYQETLENGLRQKAIQGI